MKTFGFTEAEKILILKYLMSHRMKRKDNYSCTEWEKIKKQRMRARKPLKKFLNTGVRDIPESLSKLNFDSLTYEQRIGIDDTGKVFHIPVDVEHLNEEITNLLRKVVKINSRYVY